MLDWKYFLIRCEKYSRYMSNKEYDIYIPDDKFMEFLDDC